MFSLSEDFWCSRMIASAQLTSLERGFGVSNCLQGVLAKLRQHPRTHPDFVAALDQSRVARRLRGRRLAAEFPQDATSRSSMLGRVALMARRDSRARVGTPAPAAWGENGGPATGARFAESRFWQGHGGPQSSHRGRAGRSTWPGGLAFVFSYPA